MTSKPLAGWERLEYDRTPIYLQPDRPDWFVPNRAADRLLQEWLKNGVPRPAEDVHGLLKRFGATAADPPYRSRSERLKLRGIKECWIHVTNRCNMQCSHCMFQSSPRPGDELTREQCDRVVREAYSLGCRIFFFTGGEPLLAKAFLKSVRDILKHPDTHVVVLSNLLQLARVQEIFRRLPAHRLHFQVSLDGLQASHDAIRGPGAFDRLMEDLDRLQTLGFPVTLSTTVTRQNVDDMPRIVEQAHGKQVRNLHFLWLFKKGNEQGDHFVDPERIFRGLISAQEQGEKLGVRIDNIESLRSQVFACPGTRYDLNNAGWQSLAVGPDGHVYPTPALVYSSGMRCGHIREGLAHVWQNSPVLGTIRDASLNDSDACSVRPYRYLTGGGDIDHSYIHSGRITGGDPYTGLYEQMVQWLIVREAHTNSGNSYPAIRLKMGDKLGECPAEGGSIFFTHSNCVLTLPGHDTHTQVNRYYSRAAETEVEEILNPVCYAEELVSHIPAHRRYRSYGCGSPVVEAAVQPGERLVDLGSGTGIECFVAAKLTGPDGLAIGLDMGAAMLGAAGRTKARVTRHLGYDNIRFAQAYLESLPLADNSVAVVISNCVVNLSPDKRRVFREIYRILKPGGRLVISDITYDEAIPLEIKYDEKLRGECIAGALSYPDLFGLLNDVGFSDGRVLKGYLYRTVKGHEFFSITYRAVKPFDGQPPAPYGFPDFRELMEEVRVEPSCACFTAPEEESLPAAAEPLILKRSGCMVCGAPLHYHATDETMTCHLCGQRQPANASCEKGHFVCDGCHRADAVNILKQVCRNGEERDAVRLMQVARVHPNFPVHGPEHHALVPAVILAALRNSGVPVSEEQIHDGIRRGQSVAGGACAFLGVCGAAIGVGIAFSVLSGANPYLAEKRQQVQQVTHEVLAEICALKAPRCCQRDAWLALKKAAVLLQEKMGIRLTTEHRIHCRQFSENRECIGKRCPLWPE